MVGLMMKEIEARIIIFLHSVAPMKRNIVGVSVKFDKAYDYISKILSMMVAKKYLGYDLSGSKKFFHVKGKGYFDEAKKVLAEQKTIQDKLK